MNTYPQQKIPISVSLEATLNAEALHPNGVQNKRRHLYISLLAIILAVAISAIAKLLIYLIDFITNISFYGEFSFAALSPANNQLGLWVILIPAIGGGIVGLMALYGSKAIRGHGIPEAMEQILVNQSKIKPTITYLKPISSAISIGTGGPFGAEGPIIATGGALGSTLGQLLHITHNERKILLAAGATAGMAAIFGSPIAAIFLAIELLLFEFSPRSIIPVALACITGAAGHHLFFGSQPVFEMAQVAPAASNTALATYSLFGVIIGLLSVGVTRLVYLLEDGFEKLPIHWMWWPALGGLAVGLIGYVAPRTLGVGYDNITDLLSGTLPLKVVLVLCCLKFVSWAIALASGTSGGTLAPLLTIGGAIGALLGLVAIQFFPLSGVTIAMSALVGMSAMFAGASRAFITSIVFALETTGQSNALLPLLATCSAAYIISYFLMDQTIMTEKISRRGIATPVSFEPDKLENIKVAEMMHPPGNLFPANFRVSDFKAYIEREGDENAFFIISDATNGYHGVVDAFALLSHNPLPDQTLGGLIMEKEQAIYEDASLKTAVSIMAASDLPVLTVLSRDGDMVIGLLTHRDIVASYRVGLEAHHKGVPHISLKRRTLKILIRGQQFRRSRREARGNG